MKTHYFLRVTVALFILFTVRSSFAQEVIKIDTLPTIYIFSTSLVNKKVHAAFKRDFKDAVQPRWYTMDQNYLVKFISKDQKNRALYNVKGSLIYHITYMNGDNLPKNVSGEINSKYTNDKILTAIHVEQNNRNIWVVNLKSEGSIVVARVEEDEVEEVERYTDTSI